MKTISDVVILIAMFLIIIVCALKADVLNVSTSFSVRTPKDTTINKLDFQIAGKIKTNNLTVVAERERENAKKYNNYKARWQARFFKTSWEYNEAKNIDRQEITIKYPIKYRYYSNETGLAIVWRGLDTKGQPTGYLKNKITIKSFSASISLYPNFDGELETLKSKIEYTYKSEWLGKFFFRPFFVYDINNNVDYIQGKIEIGMEL